MKGSNLQSFTVSAALKPAPLKFKCYLLSTAKPKCIAYRWVQFLQLVSLSGEKKTVGF